MCHPKVYHIVQNNLQEDIQNIETYSDIGVIASVHILEALSNIETYVSNGNESDATFVSDETLQQDLGNESDTTFVSAEATENDLGHESDGTFVSAETMEWDLESVDSDMTLLNEEDVFATHVIDFEIDANISGYYADEDEDSDL